MPFKIVSTRRRGRAELSTVPSHWENKGILRWPTHNADSLCKDEHSQPRQDFISMSFTLKRNNFPTYDNAEEELTNMLNKTDTDNDQTNQYSSIQNSTRECPNLNSLAQCLINPPVVPAANETLVQNSSSLVTDSNGVVYEVVTNGVSDQIIENAQTQHLGGPLLLQQIESMFVVQKAILDNQEKIMKKLSELSVQLDESLCNREPLVTTLSQAQGVETKKILIKAIDNIQGLQQLDTELSTPQGFESFQEKYSILCSVQPGNGTNCAYRLLDALFTKDFLCKCSWTGGSRNADVKIGFKAYKNVIKSFFVMVNSWDNTYSMENNEDFFKTVLRNALKRKDSKNVRQSAPKKRIKKGKKSGENSQAEAQEKESGEKGIGENSQAEAQEEESGENPQGEAQKEEMAEGSLC